MLATNGGRVVHASWLGIYGNCVILDHSMRIASLYGQLSSMDVNVGDDVSKDRTLGQSGISSLAGSDHLRYRMAVGSHLASPLESWDSR